MLTMTSDYIIKWYNIRRHGKIFQFGFIILAFCTPFGMPAPHASSGACAIFHAATFVANAALVVTQW